MGTEDIVTQLIQVGSKVDAVHSRLDSFEAAVGKLDKTVHGNGDSVGLKTQVAVHDSKIKLISYLGGSVILAIVLTFFGLH